ncbi:MAG: DoxX family protein [Candidatus Gottesmanbacteria bacterium GW2011_GWB1_43_11]|uniref:DoxX family protein n=1 Tax=Candidatus Gottesmanbacteria bacterium GW2011_GWB1_43_11 TaxID=1618446 RepID=A0A0G1EWG6_9BACT|nr:MAG: DoxX family protein [Candidatus Gottesmanbacteria bacterium GW2011_GWA2_42_16]KKS52102.1 MAG: DoxX family protein [Candidatus Gottesmanbacteria bacterium GW2011_GWA1_42_26]KKS81828.1 MAG: hypothetical protein UV55_C0008G0043 [Candidatus Gottesmanbacteria bacterium GW2011_GWC1_43_10]KKS87366.1 MAG: DoxX family protein [Candidatus Gottesmanbacteria bacterium GW2011_GWB1_43_11]OGG10021.1 MAG: hypothetical protein A2699_06475 [Candidatus Gottesmanbacteria bacterium RIFCSPHIGHO2_01_FULL_43_1
MQLKSKVNPQTHLLLIQLLLGLVWFRSGLTKLLAPDFIVNLPKTLTFFASKNPLPWYKDFLLQFAIPQVGLFGNLTRWGEFSAGVLLIITALTMLFKKEVPFLRHLALVGNLIGVWLNLNFGLASYWTSAASETINLLMLGIQIIIGVYHLRSLRQMKS